MEMEYGEAAANEFLNKWARDTKCWTDKALLQFLAENQARISFTVPSDVLLIPPLSISNTPRCQATPHTAFREVMHYESLHQAFSQSAQYEALGTVWMLDATAEPGLEMLSITQLQNARELWSAGRYIRSSIHESDRRYAFDVPLPAKVVDIQVVQRQGSDSQGVLMAQALPMLAGRAVVICWYAAMAQALQNGDELQVFRLLSAALSVPIRLHLCPDDDTCHLARLTFSETCFSRLKCPENSKTSVPGTDSFWAFCEMCAASVG